MIRIRLIFAAALLSASCLSGCAWMDRDDPGARSSGTILDDQILESASKRAIKGASDDLRRSNIGVTSFNGVVLLTGQVPTDQLKQQAQEAIANLRGVRRIHNELQVAGPTTLISRSNDGWLTTKVKTALIGNEEVDADRIKVVTENGVIYLMGLVGKVAGTRSAEVARNVYGVEQVVTVFEYID